MAAPGSALIASGGERASRLSCAALARPGLLAGGLARRVELEDVAVGLGGDVGVVPGPGREVVEHLLALPGLDAGLELGVALGLVVRLARGPVLEPERLSGDPGPVALGLGARAFLVASEPGAVGVDEEFRLVF